MLLIRRKVGDALFIGSDVEIIVVELTANRVVLGIVAPSTVTILRKEIRDAAEQNQSAARTVSSSVAATLAARLRQNPVR
ncbi:MAG: carbon storage regulator [Acidobacteriota bacterium]